LIVGCDCSPAAGGGLLLLVPAPNAEKQGNASDASNLVKTAHFEEEWAAIGSYLIKPGGARVSS
jgi:hypothetical protein